MINLKISMVSGEAFFIRNHSPYINSIKEWINCAIQPHGVEKKWVEIIKDVQIRVQNIDKIREVSEKEAQERLTRENSADAENDTGDERVEEIPENLDEIREIEDEGTKTSE